MLVGLIQVFVNAITSPAILLTAVLAASAYLYYVLCSHPLSRVPGPLHRRLSSIPLLATSFCGTESSITASLHARYGPIVLLGPNDVHISDGAAIAPIYSEKGGFRKAPCYHNSDNDGTPTMFSTTDPIYRASRAKSVLSMFSATKLQNDRSAQVLDECARDLVAALRTAREAAHGGTVNLMDIARRYSLDGLSGYLFGKRYGAFNGHSGKDTLSASPFVDSFVDLGRFFLFPNWISNHLATLQLWIKSSPEAEGSTAEVDSYIDTLIADAAQDVSNDTFQKRLLNAGISKAETVVQCKDAIFAGTDSTGTTLGVLIWHLVKHPECVQDLQNEFRQGPDGGDALLRATVHEGLRTSLANPVRFPRVVPPAGWTYTVSAGAPGSSGGKSFHLPAGTSVGVSAHALHLNALTYPSPHQFYPRRWLHDGPSATVKEMHRDQFAFGAGPRQCIARNLAVEELAVAVRRVVESEVLQGAEIVCKQLRFHEWFNAKPAGSCSIDIRWNV